MTDLRLREQIEQSIRKHRNRHPGDAADAILELLKGAVKPDAVEALANYQQADMEGTVVTVSRQAIEECLPVLRILAALGVR